MKAASMHDPENTELGGMQETDDDKIELVIQKSAVDPPATGKIRIIKTASLFANFVFLLAANPQTNAALVDLASLYSVTVTTIGALLSISSLAYSAGTWFGGLLYSRVNVFTLLSAFCAFFMVTMAVSTFVPNVILFFALSAVRSISGGAVDAIVNAHFLSLWDGERARDSLMQALHASWSGGAMAMGAMMNPFLSPDLQAQRNLSDLQSPSDQAYTGRVQWAYVLFACLGLLPLCSHVLLLTWDRRVTGRSSAAADAAAPVPDANGARANPPDARLTGLTAVVPVVFAVLVRVFDVYDFCGGFLTSYLFYGLGWSTPDASVAFSVFYAGQFSGRLVCIFVSAFVGPLYILIANGGFIVASSVLLGTLGHTSMVPYISAFMMGVGTSSSFPSVFLWLSNFTRITGPVSAALFLGDLTSLLSPVYVYAIETRWPIFFVWYSGVSGFASAFILVVGHVISRRLQDQHQRRLAADAAVACDAAAALLNEAAT